LTAGLVAGVLDIGAAIVLTLARGGRVARMLQGIAFGLIGPPALQGGPATAALGLLLHFVIATGAAAVYYAASRRLPILVRQAVACGIAYGVVVYLVMNLVVLPLSAIGWRPFIFSGVAIMIPIHMFCVGLPIALVVRRMAR
jgi:hypothetical protein